MKLDHNKTPFLSALNDYALSNVGPFDVPGHHMGNIEHDFLKLMGHHLFKLDVNAPRGIDSLASSTGVIKEATTLLSDLYNCNDSFFLINGTSVGIVTMIMATTKASEKIILPRNIHKSVISALILSGSIPVFINPDIDTYLGISNSVSYESYEKAILENSDAKTVFIINPTYYGVSTDISRIVEFAHSKNMVVVVDEAHGAHFHFSDKLPLSGVESKADLIASSFHKTCGSLTQSSILLLNGTRVSSKHILKTLNLLQTTSPSSLLIASIDATRKYLYFNASKDLEKTLELSVYLKTEINKINGFETFSKDYFINNNQYDYDETKVIIKVNKINLSGFELYQLLKDDYNVQMELGEVLIVLAVLTIGTTKEHCDSLINALKDISNKYYDQSLENKEFDFDYNYPNYLHRPRVIYHSSKKKVLLENSLNMICAESIIAYPPGIPLIIPGEVISQSVINRIKYLKKINTLIISDYDDGYVSVVSKIERKKNV